MGTAPEGILLYEGPTQIPGQSGDVALIVAGLGKIRTRNRKTGDMPQGYIIPIDQGNLNDAVREGREGSVCGDCIHRPSTLDGGCYVTVHWGPQRIWYTHQRGRYQWVSTGRAQQLLEGQYIRWGAWGDPAAVPLHIYWEVNQGVRGCLSYTQQWRHLDAEEWSWCMASVVGKEQLEEAAAAGWRTFRTMSSVEGLLPGEVLCPASVSEDYSVTCMRCRLCNVLYRRHRVKHIAIRAHGFREGALFRLPQQKLWPGKI
jgi:hypothetical protein